MLTPCAGCSVCFSPTLSHPSINMSPMSCTQKPGHGQQSMTKMITGRQCASTSNISMQDSLVSRYVQHQHRVCFRIERCNWRVVTAPRLLQHTSEEHINYTCSSEVKSTYRVPGALPCCSQPCNTPWSALECSAGATASLLSRRTTYTLCL